MQLSATALDASGNALDGRAVTWSSADAAIASVSATGLVSGISAGSVQITASSEGKTGSAAIVVSTAPPVPIASISVTPAAATLAVGATVQLIVTARDANDNVLTGRVVTSSSADPAIASVNSLGLVTAVSVGTTQVTVVSEGKSAIATITVTAPAPAPVASVTVSPATSNLQVGAAVQLTATTRDASGNVLTGRAVTWTSANTALATVSSTGRVTAVAAGTTQITAASEGKSGGATVTITVPTPAAVASVSVVLASGSLNPGSTTQATATTRDANNNVLTGRAITWSSTNTAVATVSATGLVQAVAIGNAQINAMSEGITSSGASLTVQAAGSTNEPSGMTVVSNRQFNALNELGWNDDDQGYSPQRGTFISDPTAPISPNGVLQVHLPAGSGEGGSMWAGDHNIPNARTLYVRYSGKFSSNWQGSSSGVDKTFYLYTSTGVPSIYFNMQGSGVRPKQPQVAGQDIVRPGTPAYNGDAHNPDWTTNLNPSFLLPLGTWHTIELLVVGNTAGNADGSIDWWVNGQHVGSYTGIQFTSGAALWHLIHYTLLYSGSTGSNPKQAQDVYFDNMYLSVK